MFIGPSLARIHDVKDSRKDHPGCVGRRQNQTRRQMSAPRVENRENCEKREEPTRQRRAPVRPSRAALARGVCRERRRHAPLYPVRVAPGPVFAPRNPTTLFSLAGYRRARNRQQYDVSPDGQRFLMIRERPGTANGGAVYVENWFTELRAKMTR